MLGSIGVVAETSHLQRAAFNAAFAEAGLDWVWSEPAYREMLARSGGHDRIARYAAARGESVDAAALQDAKTRLFREMLAQGVPARPGVAETLDEARAAGWRTAFVTTTAPGNVAAILEATGIGAEAFDLVLGRGDVAAAKPDPEVYRLALSRLSATPAEARAVEDNPDGLIAARAAGLGCVAFPGALHEGSDFTPAAAIVSRLSFQAVRTAHVPD